MLNKGLRKSNTLWKKGTETFALYPDLKFLTGFSHNW
jgi:hypothetical protein